MRSFWRAIAVFLMGGILGTGFGVIAVRPVSQAPDAKPVAPVAGDPAPDRAVATGSFIQVDPQDAAHRGSGKVMLNERSVQLGDDFEVGPGPGFHVYLVPKAEIR